MPPAVVLMETDAFAERFSAASTSLNKTKRGGWDYGKWWKTIGSATRRPTSGFNLKTDTVATLIVQDGNGDLLPLYAPGIALSTGTPDNASVQKAWTDFTLQSVVENRQEKMQLVETFGESYVFFYGESPRVIQCSGVLVNSKDFNWRAEFWANYDKYFRGSKLVERNARIYLTWDDILVQGYMFNANARDLAELPHQIPFSFSILVHRYDNFGIVSNVVGSQDLVKGALLEGFAMLNSKQGFQLVGNEKALALGQQEQVVRDRLQVELFNILLPIRGGTEARRLAEEIAQSENFGVMNTRIKNLQAQTGGSFLDALKDFLLDPAKMFNLGRSVVRGDGVSVAAGMGYGVFNAAANTELPILKTLDPLAVGSVGIAKLSDLGVPANQTAASVFSGKNFQAVGVDLAQQGLNTDDPTFQGHLTTISETLS